MLAVSRHEHEPLRGLVGYLEHAEHLFVAEDLDETGTLRRVESDLQTGEARGVDAVEVEREEVARAPVGDELSRAQVLQRARDGRVGDGDAALEVTGRGPPEVVLIVCGCYGEVYEGFTEPRTTNCSTSGAIVSVRTG